MVYIYIVIYVEGEILHSHGLFISLKIIFLKCFFTTQCLQNTQSLDNRLMINDYMIIPESIVT